MKRAGNLIEDIADINNLYYAFYKAKKGKHSKKDVLAFQQNLDKNILLLRSQILTGNVDVGNYHFLLRARTYPRHCGHCAGRHSVLDTESP